MKETPTLRTLPNQTCLLHSTPYHTKFRFRSFGQTEKEDLEFFPDFFFPLPPCLSGAAEGGGERGENPRGCFPKKLRTLQFPSSPSIFFRGDTKLMQLSTPAAAAKCVTVLFVPERLPTNTPAFKEHSAKSPSSQKKKKSKCQTEHHICPLQSFASQSQVATADERNRKSGNKKE